MAILVSRLEQGGSNVPLLIYEEYARPGDAINPSIRRLRVPQTVGFNGLAFRIREQGIGNRMFTGKLGESLRIITTDGDDSQSLILQFG